MVTAKHIKQNIIACVHSCGNFKLLYARKEKKKTKFNRRDNHARSRDSKGRPGRSV